ncbi:hypothetical protein [Kitasatospora sp. NPDC050463]|uniref:hypothetical protein n=1 Tax=Kitasatospora sp. NPDC050463 TaxID=3155786 RepID=UPI003402E55D
MTRTKPEPGAQEAATAPNEPETAADRLRSRWAEPDNTPLPWYRRMSRRTVVTAAATAAAVGVAGTLFVVLGPDEPDRFKLTAQQSIGDLTLDPEATRALADEDARIFPDKPGLIRVHDHFVVAYRTPGAADASLVVVGASGSFQRPVREIDSLLGGPDPVDDPVPAGEPQRVGYTVVPPGPLGGFMKCAATGTGSDLNVACAWSDGTTLGSVTDVKATETTIDLPALAERARAIRAAMTSKNEP